MTRWPASCSGVSFGMAASAIAYPARTGDTAPGRSPMPGATAAGLTCPAGCPEAPPPARPPPPCPEPGRPEPAGAGREAVVTDRCPEAAGWRRGRPRREEQHRGDD